MVVDVNRHLRLNFDFFRFSSHLKRFESTAFEFNGSQLLFENPAVPTVGWDINAGGSDLVKRDYS